MWNWPKRIWPKPDPQALLIWPDVVGKNAFLWERRPRRDGAEVDFALSEKNQLTQLECKLSDEQPHRALQRFALEKAPVQAVQVVRNARHSYTLGHIQVAAAHEYLNGLAV